jgi:hypothetical protein
MKSDRSELLAAGKWLAEQRAGRSHRGRQLSAEALANLLNAYLRRRHPLVKPIFQQQISGLENATAKSGPKRLQPWYHALREFIDSGELDHMLTAANEPLGEEDRVLAGYQLVPKPGSPRDFLVQTSDGEVVGKVVWSKKKKEPS